MQISHPFESPRTLALSGNGNWTSMAAWMVGLAMAAAASSATAQQKVTIRTPDGQTIQVDPSAMRGRSPATGKPGEEKPSEPPAGTEKTEGEKGDEAKKEAEPPKPPEVIRRDSVEKATGDPDELKVTLGDDGRVAFQFRSQGWTDLIGWLADISDQPIDWQELPGDAVNLISPERLTLGDTIDLFNRHLLARGYTMLQLDGGIAVVKTDAINAGLVRRVTVDELAKTPDHTFVRVTLDAGWLSSEKLAEELKPMMSPAGKLTALASTNRLEALDAAVNLRQLAKLLSEERDSASRDALAPEFRLVHIPAEEAKQLLEDFLGVKKEDAAPMSREQMQMMQQMARNNGGEMPQQKKEPEISIVANVRQNSVLVRAPLDRVAIAAEFIKRIDVPGGALKSLADASDRVQVYPLVSLDGDKLIEIVQDMNVIEPRTRLRFDKDNSAVIVSGSAADRFIIGSLIERLDGGKRRFEVLQLRRLDATEVAESIAFLMGQKNEDEDSGRSRRSSYFGYGYGDSNDSSKEKDEFRVAANNRYRQVMLWANESEMEEVRALLIKLGELPPPGGSQRTLRVIEATATPETLEYLQQLRAQWESMAPNRIVLPDASEFVDPIKAMETEDEELGNAPEDNEEPPESLPKPESPDTELTSTSILSGQFGATSNPFTLTMTEPASQNGTAPPVTISLDRDGNLMLSSPDTAALDRLENLMLQNAPPQRSYHVFRVRNASVSLVALDLEDYFKDDEQKDERDTDSFYYWYFGGGDDKKESPSGLAATGKLKFVPNSDTGTLVVTGASRDQLRTITELIELWDVPEPINPRKSRFTKLVPIRYSRAETIAETVKEAYRDLLSSNDKAFQSQRGGSNRSRSSDDDSNRDRGSGLEDSESGRDGGGQDFSFNGKLSIGIDPIGNTLLVSAEGEPLLELIVAMIDKLDTAAQPGGEVEIVQLSGNLSIEAIREALGLLGANSASSSRSSSDSRSSRSGSSRDSGDRSSRRSSSGSSRD